LRRVRTRVVPVGRTTLPLWLVRLLVTMLVVETLVTVCVLTPSSAVSRRVVDGYEKVNAPVTHFVEALIIDPEGLLMWMGNLAPDLSKGLKDDEMKSTTSSDYRPGEGS
jgi:nucleoside permease NupC